MAQALSLVTVIFLSVKNHKQLLDSRSKCGVRARHSSCIQAAWIWACGAASACCWVSFRWMVGKVGTCDGTRLTISFLELPPPLLHVRCFWFAAPARCSRWDELCFLQNGLTCCRQWHHILHWIHLPCDRALEYTQSPASLALYHQGYFLHASSLHCDQGQKEPSLYARQIDVCQPVSKLWLQPELLLSPLLFLFSLKAQDTITMNSTLRWDLMQDFTAAWTWINIAANTQGVFKTLFVMVSVQKMKTGYKDLFSPTKHWMLTWGRLISASDISFCKARSKMLQGGHRQELRGILGDDNLLRIHCKTRDKSGNGKELTSSSPQDWSQTFTCHRLLWTKGPQRFCCPLGHPAHLCLLVPLSESDFPSPWTRNQTAAGQALPTFLRSSVP